ncbi:hypothetical protein U9M48_005210 [Paspalum notatum var. saurae]|uniref:F-box domain-containing protein n=1 Tax=Paspalum notatum var. saurae TaxID=547442 RepID=A0AAQ3PX22_PASNO
MGRMSTYIIFDASVSPHFHLFHLWSNSFDFIELRTYSSESGVWTDSTSKQTQVVTGRGVPRRRCKVALTACTGNAFVNGVLHFVVFGRLIGLGCQSETCRVIRWPAADKHGLLNPLFVGQSQGRLYCICGYEGEVFFYQSGISVWVLESYDTQEWVLKHNVSFLEMFGEDKDRVHFYYNVVAIHPDCNWVFLVQNCSRELIAYDMDIKKVHALGTPTQMSVINISASRQVRDQRVDESVIMDCPNPKRRSAVAAASGLPEDVILEILARVPARSIHRFKCVSRRWRDLIADPVHRKGLPQALEGFFFRHPNEIRSSFIGLLWAATTSPSFDPSFSSSFLTDLPGNKDIRLLHTCNGLLLFGHSTHRAIDGRLGYVVCNPTTEQWVAVAGCPSPISPRYCMPAYIVFDPSVSPHFRLFNLRKNGGSMEVHTYSSESGVWTSCTVRHEAMIRRGNVWMQRFKTFMGNAFVNGMLHFVVFDRIIRLGWDGKAYCRVISWPPADDTACFLGQSQGRLYCISGYPGEDADVGQDGLSVWVLQDDDDDTQECWVLKHKVSFLELFGQKECRVDFDYNSCRFLLISAEFRCGDYSRRDVLQLESDLQGMEELGNWKPCDFDRRESSRDPGRPLLQEYREIK